MLNWFKSLLKFKPAKVKLLVTFDDGSQTTAWMTYSGWFNANAFAKEFFKEYPAVNKIKVLDFA